MSGEQFRLEDLLEVDAAPERVDALTKLVEIDLPHLGEEAKRHLLKQQVEMFQIEDVRYALRTKITDGLIDELMEDSIDTHVHGGSEPFERRELEDDIALDCTKARMKAVVIKNWYYPSASNTAFIQRVVDRWAEAHQFRPVQVFGGITLNYSVGGLNPEAVKKSLGFSKFKYVWMPTADSYYHQSHVLGRKNRGIKYLNENAKVVPELKEILHIIADNNLVLASGFYPYRETAPLMEEAKRIGVRRMELIHPTLMHSKHTLAQMRELAMEGVKIGLTGIASVNARFIEGIRSIFKIVRDLSDHMVLGSSSGQIQNPSHIEGMKWMIRVLLAHGITKGEITKIFKMNPAEHLGIN